MNKFRWQMLYLMMLVISGVLGFGLSWYRHRPPVSIALDQISPMETFHSPDLFVKQLKGDKAAGEKIFKTFCSTCHGSPPAIDIAAPRIGDKKTWSALKKLGMENLLNITINGAGAMPARGGCFECSDEQLREAIVYILKESRVDSGGFS